MKVIIISLCIILSFLSADDFYFNSKLSNTNFTVDSQGILSKKYYTYNYNRFRTDLDAGWEKQLTFKVILDLESTIGRSYLRTAEYDLQRDVSFNMPLNPYHYIVSGNTGTLRSYLYRAYSTLYLPASSLTLGYQRIPFGVGRIWNPTDILNPPNPLSIEPGERLGVYGAEYTYNFNNLSQLHSMLTLNRDNQTRDYGFRLKSNLAGYDAAVSAIRNKDIRMSGLELEGELLDTKIGVRLEAAHFENYLLENTYYEYIWGVDYAFPNSLYLVAEFLLNENGQTDKHDYSLALSNPYGWSQLAKQYLGLTATYELTPLVNISTSEIINLNDGSYFISPGLQWSLADSTDLNIGSSFFCGTQYSEFWYYKNLGYISLSVYF